MPAMTYSPTRPRLRKSERFSSSSAQVGIVHGKDVQPSLTLLTFSIHPIYWANFEVGDRATASGCIEKVITTTQSLE